MTISTYFSIPYTRMILRTIVTVTLLLVLFPLFTITTHAQSLVTNIVYVATSANVSGYPNPEDSGSTNKSTVHIPWHVGPNCPACFITFHGGDIYTATSNIVTRNSVQTGKLESITKTSAPIVAPLVVTDKVFYVATSQGIDAYPDPDGVTPIWHWPLPPCLACGVTFNQGLIYARSDASVAVLDASSGKLLGAHTFSSSIITDPIFDGAAPIIQTRSSILGFSDPYFIGQNWQIDTPVVTCIACGLFMPQSQAVVATVGKSFYTLNATSGKLIASTALPAAPIRNSVSVGNTLQIITTEGTASCSFSGVADGDDVPLCGNGIHWWWPHGGLPRSSGFDSATSPITGSIINYVGADTALFAVDATTGKQLNTIQLQGTVQSVQVATLTAG